METKGRFNFLIAFMVGITILIGFFNLHSLREVRKLQKVLKIKIELLEEKNKELDKKNMIYDKKFDLRKIRENMETEGMTIADDVIFFEVGD